MQGQPTDASLSLLLDAALHDWTDALESGPQSIETAQKAGTETAVSMSQAKPSAGETSTSSFGLQKEPALQQPEQNQHSSIHSGLLGMSAFGMSSEPDDMPAESAKSQQSAVESEMLDKSAFGMTPESAQHKQSALDSEIGRAHV